MSFEKKLVEYKDGNNVLEGVLVYPKGTEKNGKKLTTVVLYHAWGGIDNFEISQTEALAKAGYVAFAADIYGKGQRGKTREVNAELMKPYAENRNTLLKNRLIASINFIKSINFVDANKLYGVGFCFGGMSVLDAARHNLGFKGVVSYHGLLGPVPELGEPSKLEPIKATVVVCHGDADIFIPADKQHDFMQEMRERKVDWSFHIYANAAHGYTMPANATSTMNGVNYDEKAARRSWKVLLNLLDEK